MFVGVFLNHIKGTKSFEKRSFDKIGEKVCFSAFQSYCDNSQYKRPLATAPIEQSHLDLASIMPEYESVSHRFSGNELLFQPAQIQPFEQKPKRNVLKILLASVIVIVLTSCMVIMGFSLVKLSIKFEDLVSRSHLFNNETLDMKISLEKVMASNYDQLKKHSYNDSDRILSILDEMRGKHKEIDSNITFIKQGVTQQGDATNDLQYRLNDTIELLKKRPHNNSDRILSILDQMRGKHNEIDSNITLIKQEVTKALAELDVKAHNMMNYLHYEIQTQLHEIRG